ncbi:uncharacterized protein LOC110814074 isoform X2 [Carica papaya]|uniref:uncharacterized protein LOC110814074 isoform X2 n=1 Tax=Carica papaya TaxID=3649 RepID=UPI000B8C8F68|nr:uncharacterized protein LOC110814074 isoform X2 [Carica papaya]
MSFPFFPTFESPREPSPPGYSEQAPAANQQREDSQQKEEFWVADYHNENNVFSSGKKNEIDNLSPTTNDNNDLPPVPPGSGGDGLPYAPVDWPNPGDIWSWRVGKRISSSGFFQDRFLILPKGLQKANYPRQFASKPSLLRYIQTEFPIADIDAFFESFSWKVPALLQPVTKEVASLPPEGETQEVKVKGEVQNDGKEQTHRSSLRPRREKPKEAPPVEKKTGEKRGSTQKKRKEKPTTTATPSKQKPRRSSRSAVGRTGGAVDLNSFNDEATGESPTKDMKSTSGFDDDQVSIPHIYISPLNGVIAACHSPVEIIPEEFDNYLSSLDDLLTQPSEVPLCLPSANSSPIKEHEIAGARVKLSSLLHMEFSQLVFSNDVSILTNLVTKLRRDPTLSAEQLVMLKLVEEIPTFREVYLENKEVIDQADSFFSALEVNKSKVASLKSEYNELKDKITQIQIDVDKNSSTIQEIDEQIAQLQSRRAELTRLINSKNKEKLDLNYAQKMVAGSIPRVVQEIQGANFKKSEWERKKENALKREAEIHAKFSPLKGFHF